ncbi:MAG: thymidylate kinase, partial [Clostridia bacterium]|nr:thymidylate kinase [Clostridia bacterium]
MGRFIVIDGLDGSGKHTQLTRLADHLRSLGKKVRTIDFPHYNTPGCVLVEEYLNGKFGDKPEDT